MLIGLVYYYGITGFLSGTFIFEFSTIFLFILRIYLNIYSNYPVTLFSTKIYTYIAHGIPLWAATSNKSFSCFGFIINCFYLRFRQFSEYSFALGILSFGLSLGFAIEHVISRQMLFKKGEKSNTEALKSNIKNYIGSPL